MLEKIVNLTKKLVKCRSISPFDAGCQNILIKILKKLNFHIKLINIKNTKNFWAFHNGNNNNNNTLVFAGHTDVVSPGNIKEWKFDPFKAIIKNNILYGRGTCDMKGSLAAMIIAVEKFITKYPIYNGRLAFLITSDEESNAKNGTIQVINKLIKKKEKLDYCIIGEPTSNKVIGDNIKNGRRGSLNVKLKIIGVQGHVAYHNLAKNPIHMIIPVLQKLILTKWSKKNFLFPETSMQITRISSDIKNINVIPGNIILYINFRFNNKISYKDILKKLDSIIKKYIIFYKIEWNLSGLPFLSIYNPLKKNKNLLKIVKKNINLINNINTKVINNGGTSDGRFIIKTGTQIVELGLINSTIHKINECVCINDLNILYKIYYKIIKEILIL
ncbi:succinyl-diaminopimelate desuccinylase [Enterobacteriaceae endosymbiont of Donacia versicolorea]|uniref:succinyl-diaminopimelate desuccinylase n=1 Tax=Enterobacteriaceae endosymbiont of Donacia versicolorea TaxID=2675788 RepID=UPI001449C86B|nr:succinyl-diaminopimelate desuccinylase [Enterobacteriaceae endosymbiont of Donacia versicolorea]QJC32075.1 succinyl-diaminopimelate desuccinylase [Enterobacteriaceae endosymbiont of Donacia versicolorea]